MQTVHTVRMVATSLLVMTGLVAGLLLVGLALIRRSRMSTTPNANSSSSGGDSSWMLYSGFSGGDSGHGGGSDCSPSDSGTSDAGCDSGGSDGGGGDGGGGGSD
jgi:hypothetical protein